jgi:hypothetical protein
MQEFDKVHGTFGSFALVPNDTIMEKPDVGSTTGRRSHDIVIAAEQLVVVLDEFLSLVLEAGIAHGLTTAGLLLGILDIEPQAAEKFVGSNAHLGVEGIYITGYE